MRVSTIEFDIPVNLIAFLAVAMVAGLLGSRRRQALLQSEALARQLQEANTELIRLNKEQVGALAKLLGPIGAGRSQMCHAFAEPGGNRRKREDTNAREIEHRRTRKETPGHGRTRRTAGSGP